MKDLYHKMIQEAGLPGPVNDMSNPYIGCFQFLQGIKEGAEDSSGLEVDAQLKLYVGHDKLFVSVGYYPPEGGVPVRLEEEINSKQIAQIKIPSDEAGFFFGQRLGQQIRECLELEPLEDA